MEQTQIGLKDDVRKEVSKILDKVLADEYVLYTKLRNFHWNVRGPHFNEYHKFFEEQYDKLIEYVDEIAERQRMIGAFPKASLQEFLELTQLKEVKEILSAEEMIQLALDDHETMIRTLRQMIEELGDLGDHGNEDFLIELLQEHEKMAWMLRSMNS